MRLLSKPEAREDYPFGPNALVVKVRDKLLGILGEKNGLGHINLKCDPDEALMLRDIFDAVIPRSLSDLGRIYCGSKKSVPFPDHFRRIGSLFASNDRKNALDLSLPRYDPLSPTGS
jgi:hypothetical protein